MNLSKKYFTQLPSDLASYNIDSETLVLDLNLVANHPSTPLKQNADPRQKILPVDDINLNIIVLKNYNYNFLTPRYRIFAFTGNLFLNFVFLTGK